MKKILTLLFCIACFSFAADAQIREDAPMHYEYQQLGDSVDWKTFNNNEMVITHVQKNDSIYRETITDHDIESGKYLTRIYENGKPIAIFSGFYSRDFEIRYYLIENELQEREIHLQYNQKGDLLRETVLSEDGTPEFVFEYTYIYNDKGHWINRKVRVIRY